MGIHKDTEILKLLHFLYAVQITLYWHTILFLMHQWLHVNLVRGVILKYTSKIAKKPLKSAHVNHQKKNKVYFICRCILFNINTKSLILIYKEIYKYVFLKIYRQAYFSTLLNMHLLLYIDTHTLQKEAFVPTCCLPACTSCFILGKEWHFSSFAPYPFCFRYTLLLYSISTHS